MKLKKIASLLLAGTMALTMLAGCADSAPITEPDAGEDNGVVDAPVNDMTDYFTSGLSDKANLKINMSYSDDLQDDLAYATGEVGYATIVDFSTALRTAGTVGGSGVRTVANFDKSGTVYVANYNSQSWKYGAWYDLTNNKAGDLSAAAIDMGAVNVQDAFKALIPEYNESASETVTMLFVVDHTIGQANAVNWVGQLLSDWIEQLRIDDDNSADLSCGPDATTFHYVYNGSVALQNKTIDNHGMGLNLIAVEITRVATLPHL